MLLSTKLKPCRITDVLLNTDADGETIIRQRGETKASRLNSSATYIWQLCEGKKNIGQLVEMMRDLKVFSDESIEKKVSDTIASLFSEEILDFSNRKLKPLATLSYSDYGEKVAHFHDFFNLLFGQWFDLNVVTDTEKSDIYINISNPEHRAELTPLQIYVGLSGETPSQDYDFIFTAERDERIPLDKNVLLPEFAINKDFTALLAEEQMKLSCVLGEVEAKKKKSTGEKAVANKGVSQNKKLTIGMATYDDYDGVYFSVQAIRMYHPEVTELTEILVIDNNPTGPCAEDLRKLSTSVPGYRYMAVDEIRGTAVRDFVFREANTDYVMCIDSHVYIEPGAIRKLIDYFDANPDTPDLLQGPLVYDDLKSISTHFEPAWRQGMFGFWSVGECGKKITDEPFDIPMQGLGLAACRKQAWQGYNPRFRGFGGEEGYIHQKFRNAGARTLCLPFLRWMHRFSRPMGTRYPNVWEERIRNYLIGFEEVGLDIELLRQHFYKMTSKKVVEEVIQAIKDEEKNPFNFFDAIYCINLDTETDRWQEMTVRLESLGISKRVVRFSAVNTPESHHIGCALSHRRIIERARKFGYKNVLVLEDDAMFHIDTQTHLANALSELENVEWNAFYLGGMKWGEKRGVAYEKINDCKYLEYPKLLTCTHAIAYNHHFFDTILNEMPDEYDAMKDWVAEHVAIDQYLTTKDKLVLMSPVIATQANIQGSEDESIREGFH